MTGVLALILLAAPPAPASGAAVQVIEHYAIEVPPGYALKDASPQLMDFDLYALTDQRTGAVKCTLYFGNAPQFPKLRWSGRPVETKQGGGTRREFRSPERIEGLLTFEGLSYKNVPFSPFESIHYFADHLSAAEPKAVAAMVDSVRVAKKKLE